MNDYQIKASKYADYDNVDYAIPALAYLVLGLAGETGELVEKVKKHYRDNIFWDRKSIDDLMKEAGDVLYFISEIAREFNHNLQEVADMNIEKLESRWQRDMIKGSGDNR